MVRATLQLWLDQVLWHDFQVLNDFPVVAEDRRMHSRPLSSLGRILLVAGAVGFGSASLLAQNSSSTAPKPKPALLQSRQLHELTSFAGYSYLAPHGTLTIPAGANIGVHGPVSYSSINYGAIGSVHLLLQPLRRWAARVRRIIPTATMTEPPPGSLVWSSAIRLRISPRSFMRTPAFNQARWLRIISLYLWPCTYRRRRLGLRSAVLGWPSWPAPFPGGL